MRDDFHFMEFAGCLIAVGLAWPAVALLRMQHEVLAATIALGLPLPLCLLRLRVELYSWRESFVIFHLKSS